MFCEARETIGEALDASNLTVRNEDIKDRFRLKLLEARRRLGHPVLEEKGPLSVLLLRFLRMHSICLGGAIIISCPKRFTGIALPDEAPAISTGIM